MVPAMTKPEADLMGEAGDRWMESLSVTLSTESKSLVIKGSEFENLATALGIRHLCLHPRTRDIIPGSIPVMKMKQMLDQRWSAIESHGANDLANQIIALRGEGYLLWAQS